MPKEKGKVFLTGAGPGDLGLLTLRAKEVLERADVVIYDSLVNLEILSLAVKAEKIFAGKRGSDEQSASQEKIHQLLARFSERGKNVVRLKGGDPLIFGRVGEEALFLKKRKIPFEIVPGVTAASGAAACAGIPLTHREWASQVTFVTAHEDSRKKESGLSWKLLAEGSGSLAFYMGVQKLPEVVRKLITHGMSSKMPAAVIQQATTPFQKVVTGTLETIVQKANQSQIRSPAVTIIGEVVKCREQLDWFSERPLFGKTVLVTRARHQAGFLRKKLEELGAEVIECPVIEILQPLSWKAVDEAVRDLKKYDWIVFTSVNGVEHFFERMYQQRKDLRSFGEAKICAIGPATAEALKARRLFPDLVPAEYVSESLVKALWVREDMRDKKILLLRADKGRDYLREALEKKGAVVDNVTVYRTVSVRPKIKKEVLERLRKNEIHFVTFTSSSTVTHFISLVGKKNLQRIKKGIRWISIGPITSQTAKQMGLKIHLQAKPYTIDGVVNAVVRSSS